MVKQVNGARLVRDFPRPPVLLGDEMRRHLTLLHQEPVDRRLISALEFVPNEQTDAVRARGEVRRRPPKQLGKVNGFLLTPEIQTQTPDDQTS